MKDFAVIFDMDGVIVDNAEFHKKAWREFCEKYGKHLSEDEMRSHIYGRTNRNTLKYIFDRKMSDLEIVEYGEEKERIYRALYAPLLKTTPHLIDFLKLLQENKITTIIATSADKPNIDFVLDGLEIRKYFSNITDASEVKNGKPNPEVYLLAAKKIGFDPNCCIVIEDSVSGVRAGKAAGMKVIAITTTHTKNELGEADLIINDFSELTLGSKLHNLADL